MHERRTSRRFLCLPSRWSRPFPLHTLLSLLLTSLVLATLPAAASVRAVRRIRVPDGEQGPRVVDLPGPSPRSSEAVGLVLDSTYYDYQGHGALPSRIAAIGDSALHILPYVGEDPALAVRGPKYIYYIDGALTSFGYVGSTRSGFGALTGRYDPSGGLGNVAAATVPVDLPDSLDLNWHVFVDAFQGTGAFSPFTVDPGPEIDPCDRIREPSIWARNDPSGAMAMAAMTVDDCSGGFPDILVTWTDAPSGGWAPPLVLDTLEDPSAWNAGPEPPVLAGSDDGRLGVVTTDFGTNVYDWESTDAGVTWGLRIGLTDYPATPHRVPPDSTSTEYRPLQGATIAFAPDGTPHVVWTEYQARGSGADSIYTPGVDPLWQYRTRLMHWDPAHGATVVYRHPAGLADEARGTAYAYNVGHPTIGFADGDGFVYVVFEGFVDADRDAANGLGYGDIYATFSDDGGETWSPRVNVTGSPGIDDLYPSIPRLNPPGAFGELPWLRPASSDDVVDFVLLYQSDGMAGTFVQGDEAEPDRDHLLLAAVDAFESSMGGIEGGGEGSSGHPRAFTLAQNAPNPFNPSTTIAYSLAAPARVEIAVYDLRGRRVRTLVEGERNAGTHEVTWDGRDDRGTPLPGGAFFCSMEADGVSRATRKMVLLK